MLSIDCSLDLIPESMDPSQNLVTDLTHKPYGELAGGSEDPAIRADSALCLMSVSLVSHGCLISVSWVSH